MQNIEGDHGDRRCRFDCQREESKVVSESEPNFHRLKYHEPQALENASSSQSCIKMSDQARPDPTRGHFLRLFSLALGTAKSRPFSSTNHHHPHSGIGLGNFVALAPLPLRLLGSGQTLPTLRPATGTYSIVVIRRHRFNQRRRSGPRATVAH